MVSSKSASKKNLSPQEVDRSKNSENPKHPLFNFIIQSLVIGILFFALGYSIGVRKLEFDRRSFIPHINISSTTPPKDVNVDFSLLWNVIETLPEKYIDKSAIDGNKILYGAISGAVRSLGDPYTAFLDPKQNQSIKDELSGSYSGVGIQIGFNRDKRLAVIAPLRGTPAEKAGVKAKDLILKIDDKDTFEMTLPEAVDLIRGAAGTKINLVLARDGSDKPIGLNLERAQITVKSVEVSYAKDGTVAVVVVSRFGDTTDKEWDGVVSEIQKKNVKGVVVDMRNNPGGLLSSAIHLASEFTRGTIVKQQFADGSQQSLPSDHEGKLAKVPLSVIINGGSASAAEIFAGAIQDYKRGKIIGEKSFGKGTVQDVIDLPGGSGLHVTIAKWLTPTGKSINGAGITPDISVVQSNDDRDSGHDSQLDRAIGEL